MNGNQPPGKSFWRIGELAKAAGMSSDTLRHYERKGVLPRAKRSQNGYREYPEDSRHGGMIQVETNDANDKESRERIRQHLRHIARMFAEGNFAAPMLIHSKRPVGTDVMQQLKQGISYKFEETKRGGRLVIASGNVEAIQAIHEFLIFQIKEHKTGDSLKVQIGRGQPLDIRKFTGWEGRFTPACVGNTSTRRPLARNASGGKPPLPGRLLRLRCLFEGQ